jgi:PilZ domain
MMSSTTAHSERRNNMRNRPPSLIYVELSSTNGGMMRDLSEEGFALRVMMPLTDGDKTSFSFSLNPICRIVGEGEVIWTEENGRVAGIRFTELSSSARADIQSWLNGKLESVGKPDPHNAVPEDEPRVPFRDEKESSSPGPGRSLSRRRWEVPLSDSSDAESFPREAAGAPGAGIGAVPAAGRLDPSPSGGFTPRPNVQSPALSDVLMQPPSREREQSSRPPTLEPLDSWHHGRPMHYGSRSSWFTLPRALLIMVLLALGVGAYVYREAAGEGLIWVGQQIGGTQTTPPPAPSPVTQEMPAATDTNKPASNQLSGNEPASGRNSNDPTASQSASPALQGSPQETPPAAAPADTSTHSDAGMEQPDARAATVPKPAPPATRGSRNSPPISMPESEQQAGATEYAEAQRLLHGPPGTTDPAEAVRLLWIAVEKGNSEAELTLAELYWHGKGVARNCDQTRILLSAAARKGNVEAQTRLRQFGRIGCE